MARILVIDDEDALRQLLRFSLESRGREIVEARHGDEALKLLRASPVDLVITDIHMPGKDGLEVMVTLRQEFPAIRVIAMSGGGRFVDFTSFRAAAPLGAIALLPKPFPLDKMFEAVDQALAA